MIILKITYRYTKPFFDFRTTIYQLRVLTSKLKIFERSILYKKAIDQKES